MKHHFAIIAFALASCAAPLEETTLEECCMPVGQGQIFASGISILLKGPNEALQIADGNPPVKYLHFVGVNGQTVVPTYEPDGLDAGQGSKIGGAKLVLVSAADLAGLEARVAALESDESIVALTARVEALEAQLEAATADNTAGTLVKRGVNGDIFTSNFRGNLKEASNGGFVKIINYGGQEVVRFGQNGGNPALRFFDGGTLVLQQALIESDPNLPVSTANALGQFGLVTVTP